jgi:hypothetical protein
MSSDKKVDMFNPRPPEFHSCPPGACDRQARESARNAQLSAVAGAFFAQREAQGDLGARCAQELQKDKIVRTTFTREEVLTVLKAKKASLDHGPETEDMPEMVRHHMLAELIRTFERME